jgi:excinuclease ABC subunit B
MYADKITRSMQQTIDETNRRREKQLKYNSEMGITPAQIFKKSSTVFKGLNKKGIMLKAYFEPDKIDIAADPVIKYMNKEALEKAIEKTRKAMEKAASELDFIEAARYRDELSELHNLLNSKI